MRLAGGVPSRRAALLVPWLIVSAIMLALAWKNNILLLRMWDPDDYMRLEQIRDWLGGQSWFDVTQYRLDAPRGFQMHWSRLVDLPIAGLIVALRPLLGAVLAERVAITVVPLLILGLIMALVTLATRRSAGERAALVAPLLVACCPLLLFQTMPLRIDHHGWQTMMAVATLACLIGDRPARSGLLAGLCAAIWLSVSLEGVPLVATVFGLLILRFLIDPRHAARLHGFAGALAVGSALWFTVSHHASAWSHTACDAMGPGWIALLSGSAIGALIATRHLADRPWFVRGAVIAAGAGIGLALFLHVAPGCTSGPFGGLDPVTRRFWYQNVLEGRPIWFQPPELQGMIIIFPLVGLTGMALGWRRARATGDAAAARNWTTLALLALTAFGLALLVQRTAAVAHAFALPGAAFLLQHALGVVRHWRRMVLRVIGSTVAILGATPLTAGSLGTMIFSAVQPPAPETVPEATLRCARACDRYGALQRLPSAYLLSGLDLAPSLLIHTRHSFAGSGYHRNPEPLRRVIEGFIGDPEATRRMMAARGMAYVLIDPESSEAALYAKTAPNGLMARLVHGQVPGWLRPVPLPGSPFRLWKRIG